MKSKFSYLLIGLTILFSLVGCNEKLPPLEEEDMFNPDTEVENPEFSKERINLTQKELRGVWLTTVWNNDWPSTTNNPGEQKRELIRYFNLFEECNINTVFFQIRGMADAFYESKYEPWSAVFTGVQGKNPGWDPIGVAIEEAHKRGMQLHAWMNPYRIATRGNSSSNFRPLDSRIPKELTKDYNQIRMYNPALPEARQRIADIVTEVLTKYPELDGIHFDDYFYPSNGQCAGNLDDLAEYEVYNPNNLGQKAWRMENVNQMVQLIQKTVKAINPNMIFTISPAGNMSYNRDQMFADVEKWCDKQWIDAIIPQLYWGHRYFDPALKEFCGFAKNTPVLVGYGTYNFKPKPDPGFSSEFKDAKLFEEEHTLASSYKQVKGGVHFDASALRDNQVGITDKIKEVYGNLRLVPYLGSNEVKPETPRNPQITDNILSWEGDAVKYAIYKDNGSGKRRGKNATLIGITKDRLFELPGRGTYYITAIDKYNAESLVTDMIELK